MAKKEVTAKPETAVRDQQADKWLTTREACEYAGITRRTLYKWAKAENWQVAQVYTPTGAQNRYRQTDLDAKLSQRVGKGTYPSIHHSIHGVPATQWYAMPPELLTVLESLAAEQRRANDLRERELALKEQQLKLDMSANNSSTAPHPEPKQGYSQSPINTIPVKGLRQFIIRLLEAVLSGIKGRY